MRKDILDDITGEPEPKMERVEMRADERLAKLVATRQSGDPKKGIRELIQNAEDTMRKRRNLTGEEPAPIEIYAGTEGGFPDDGLGDSHPIKLTGSFLTFVDSGYGFDTPEDFLEKMSIMGGEWKGVDDRGEFGIGKGQAIGMIYNPTKDDYDGEVEITTMIKGEPWRIDGFRVEGGKITFNKPYMVKNWMSEEKIGDPRWGTMWHVKSNKLKTFNSEEISEYLEENVKGIPIKLNGDMLDSETYGKKVDVPGATVWFRDDSAQFTVYNRGIRIAEEKVVRGWGGDIITTKNLKTSMSREEIMQEDATWKEIKTGVEHVIISQIDDMAKFSDEQKRGVLNILIEREDRGLYSRWQNKRIVKLVDGKVITLQRFVEMAKSHGGFFYGGESQVNSELTDHGIPIVTDAAHWYLDSLLKVYHPNEAWANYDKIEESIFYIERKGKKHKLIDKSAWTHDEILTSKLLEEIIKESGLKPRSVLWGKAPSMGWTNGKDYVALNRDKFKHVIQGIKEGGAKQASIMHNLMPILIHEMAHDTDNRGTDAHATSDFYESYNDATVKLSGAAARMFREDTFYSPLFGKYIPMRVMDIEKGSKSKAMKSLKEVMGI